jgi:CHAT domain
MARSSRERRLSLSSHRRGVWQPKFVAGEKRGGCRSEQVAPLLGREVFGLVTGVLGGGVRAVLAGLWPVAAQEAAPLMWHFYRHPGA